MFPKIPNYLVTSVSSLFLVSRLIGHGWSRLLLTQDFSRLLITSWDFSSLLRLITLSVIVHHQQHHQVSRKLMLFLMAVGSTTSTWIDRNSWPHFKLRNWSSLFEVKHNAWRSHYHTSDLQTSLTTFEVGKDDGPCSKVVNLWEKNFHSLDLGMAMTWQACGGEIWKLSEYSEAVTTRKNAKLQLRLDFACKPFLDMRK